MAEMTKEARAARAKYMREWRKKNPEKQREYDAKKWERKGQQIRQEREAAEMRGNNARIQYTDEQQGRNTSAW